MFGAEISEETKQTLRFKVKDLSPIRKQFVARLEISELLKQAHALNVTACVDLVSALNDIGFAYFVSGELLLAAPFFDKALSLARDDYRRVVKAHADDEARVGAARDLLLMCLRFVAVLRSSENAYELVASALDESIALLGAISPYSLVHARGASEPPFEAAALLCEQLERIAVVRNEMGLSRKAIDALTQAIALRHAKPDNLDALGHAYNLRGRMQRDLGEFASAIESHTQAAKAFKQTSENHAISRVMLAEVLSAAGDHGAAKSCIRGALNRLYALFPRRDTLAMASGFNVATKVHTATGGVLIAYKYKKAEFATVEAVLRQQLGDVSEHPKLKALQLELTELHNQIRERTSLQQKRYRTRKAELAEQSESEQQSEGGSKSTSKKSAKQESEEDDEEEQD